MLEFVAAAFFLIVTPGPGVLSTAGVGASYGAAAGYRYIAGLWAGNNLVGLLVVSGIAASALAVPWLRIVLVWGSTAYLLCMAARIALAGGARLAFIVPDRAPGIWEGLALQPINPKAYAVNTAFFSNFLLFPGDPGWEIAVKFAIINLIWIPVHVGWLWAGLRLRALDLGPRVSRAINIGMASAMLMVVALAVFAQI